MLYYIIYYIYDILYIMYIYIFYIHTHIYNMYIGINHLVIVMRPQVVGRQTSCLRFVDHTSGACLTCPQHPKWMKAFTNIPKPISVARGML